MINELLENLVNNLEENLTPYMEGLNPYQLEKDYPNIYELTLSTVKLLLYYFPVDTIKNNLPPCMLSIFNGLAVWFCKPTTPLQSNDKLSKAYRLYRLLATGAVIKSRKMENILESRIEFKNNKLFRITVLVEFSKGDVRAIYADTKPKGGYMFLKPNQELNTELLQEVAGYGSERNDKDDMFPGWHSKLSELRSTER